MTHREEDPMRGRHRGRLARLQVALVIEVDTPCVCLGGTGFTLLEMPHQTLCAHLIQPSRDGRSQFQVVEVGLGVVGGVLHTL
jgi:hypothetical protein